MRDSKSPLLAHTSREKWATLASDFHLHNAAGFRRAIRNEFRMAAAEGFRDVAVPADWLVRGEDFG